MPCAVKNALCEQSSRVSTQGWWTEYVMVSDVGATGGGLWVEVTTMQRCLRVATMDPKFLKQKFWTMKLS